MNTSRRAFLFQVAAGGLVLGGGLVGLADANHAADLPRPPGAITEEAFLSRCLRCMRCIDVCEFNALTVGHLEDGIRNIGTPVLHIDQCRQCMHCAQVCPSGALARVDAGDLHLGLAVIDQQICVAMSGKRECRLCADVCPAKAVSFIGGKPAVAADTCVGCGACLRACPEFARGAITVDTTKGRRFDAPASVMLSYQDNTRYEESNVFSEWLVRRLEQLGRTYGVR